MATTRKKTTTPERSPTAAPQAASRSAGRTTTARTAGSAKPAGAPEITAEQVSRRAFELWQEAGQPHGHDVDHWLQAEAELRDRS